MNALNTWRRRLLSWHRPHRLLLRACPHAPGQAAVIAAATQAFADWAAQHEGAVVELALSSHFLLLAVGEAGHKTDAPTLREQARSQWAHYLDLSPEGLGADWRVQTSLDGGRAPVAVACALPRELADGLQQAARQHRVRLQALQPWWAEPLQRAWSLLPAQPDGAPDAQRRWTWQEGGWQTQAQAVHHADGWRLNTLVLVAAERTDERVDERVDAPPAEALVALDASVLSARVAGRERLAWAESLNFVGPRVRTSFWSWALLALGAIARVHAMALSREVEGAEQSVQADLARLQKHAQLGPGGPGLAPPVDAAEVASSAQGAPAAPLLQAEGWRSAAQLAAWLNHPWAKVLDHADASAHQRGISLLRFQLDVGTWGERSGQALAWRLQAAVPDDQAAWTWLQDLGPQAELLRRDALAQPVPGERGTLLWRIDVSAAGGAP